MAVPLLLLVAWLLPSACAGNPSLRGIVKVGLVAPFSGADYATGYNALFAAKLAIREWNERGGPGGYRVEMVALDEAGGSDAARLPALKLTLDGDVMGVVGHLSPDLVPGVAEAYRESGLALLDLGGGRNGADPSSARYALVAGQDAVAEAIGRAAVEWLGTRDAAVLTSPSDGSQQLAGKIRDALVQRGLVLRGAEVVPATTRDRRSLARRLGEEEPALIVLVGGGDQMGPVVVQLREEGVGSALLVGPVDGPTLPQIAGAAGEGVFYFSLSAHPSDLPGAEGFVPRYRALAGRDPWGVAALTYDATNLLLEAVARAAGTGTPTRERVAAVLGGPGCGPGVTGPISFDGHGFRQGAGVFFYQLTGGEFPGKPVWR